MSKTVKADKCEKDVRCKKCNSRTVLATGGIYAFGVTEGSYTCEQYDEDDVIETSGGVGVAIDWCPVCEDIVHAWITEPMFPEVTK